MSTARSRAWVAWVLGAALCALSGAALAQEAPAAQPVQATPALTTLPLGRGLPVAVRVGVEFVEVQSIDENEGSYVATVDLRLEWDDPRLRFGPAELLEDVREYRGAEADERLRAQWWPQVELANLAGEPTRQSRGLRLTPEGHVVLMQRTTGRFVSRLDASHFPFDTQHLLVSVSVERDARARVALDFHQDDLDFSQTSAGLRVEGWHTGPVTLRREPLMGWFAESHSRVFAELEIARDAGRSAPAIFIPLLASLLIPLLALWLNRIKDGEFTIEAFELTNVVVGGLFAVIALNFTVAASFKLIASGDNTVTRLFSLNYVTLGVSLLINIGLFRFNLLKRFFGAHVQQEFYLFCMWAIPLLSLATAAAIVAAAMV